MALDTEHERSKSEELSVAEAEQDEDVDEAEAGDKERARALSNADLQREHHDDHGRKTNTPDVESHRFEGDTRIDAAMAGTSTYKVDDYGGHILKLQMALIDLGYKIPGGATGVFDKATKKAVKKFQRKVGLSPTGKINQATMAAIEKKFDSRKPYVKAGKHGGDHAATHELTETERNQALVAMAPITGAAAGTSDAFIDVVNGEMYGQRLKAQLQTVIADDQKFLFEDRKALHDDPKKLHDWKTMEGPAKAAKKATDKVYGGWAKEKSAAEISVDAGTLVDNWDDQTEAMNNQSPDENRQWARDKVWYYITSDNVCATINEEHHANVGGKLELGILTPLVELLTNTPEKVKALIQTEIGWDGMSGDGVVKIQRFKQATKKENRAQLWGLFHTCIHEYLHVLAHDDLWGFVDKLEAAGDFTRAHTLREGFCDFFTLNVRASLDIDAEMQESIEGPYNKSEKKPPPIDPGLYADHAEAERVVGVVGIQNAMAGYFQGKTKLIGDE